MTNKSITSIILISVLALVILAGGFWYIKKHKVNTSKKYDVISYRNNESLTDDKEKNKNLNFEYPLTDEEFDIVSKKQEEILKKLEEEKNKIAESDLVWYEIPELEVKFKVTKDEKDNLKYFINAKEEGLNEEIVSATLYEQSVVDFIGKENCLNKDSENVFCYNVIIRKIPFNLNEVYEKSDDTNDVLRSCKLGWQKNILKDNVFCSFSPQFWIFKSINQYEDYIEKTRDKIFFIFLDKMEIL